MTGGGGGGGERAETAINLLTVCLVSCIRANGCYCITINKFGDIILPSLVYQTTPSPALRLDVLLPCAGDAILRHPELAGEGVVWYTRLISMPLSDWNLCSL